MKHNQRGFTYFQKVLFVAPYSICAFMFVYVYCFKHPLWGFWWSLWRKMQEHQSQYVFQSFWLSHWHYFCIPPTSTVAEPALRRSRGMLGNTGGNELGSVWSSLETVPKQCSASAKTTPGLALCQHRGSGHSPPAPLPLSSLAHDKKKKDLGVSLLENLFCRQAVWLREWLCFWFLPQLLYAAGHSYVEKATLSFVTWHASSKGFSRDPRGCVFTPCFTKYLWTQGLSPLPAPPVLSVHSSRASVWAQTAACEGCRPLCRRGEFCWAAGTGIPGGRGAVAAGDAWDTCPNWLLIWVLSC